MSFKPILSLKSFPKDSSWFCIGDATQAYNSTTNPSGWGCPGGPENSTDITDVRIQYQPFSVLAAYIPTASLEGSLFSNAGLLVKATVAEGVSLIYASYGMVSSGNISSDGSVTISTGLTGDEFIIEYGGVNYVAASDNPNTLLAVKSIDSVTGTITLYSPYVSETTTLTKYYTGVMRILNINTGKGNLLKDIAKMAITYSGCESNTELMDKLLLQIAVETAFNCGDYSKAHKGALVLAGMPTQFKTCKDC